MNVTNMINYGCPFLNNLHMLIYSQKWDDIDCTQAINFSQSFSQIPECLFLISDVIVTCLTVVRHLTFIPLSLRFLRTQLHPSASMALDDVTLLTWTTLKSTVTIYVPYFTQCPGLSYRPSPHMSNLFDFLNWCSLHVLSMTVKRRY